MSTLKEDAADSWGLAMFTIIAGVVFTIAIGLISTISSCNEDRQKNCVSYYQQVQQNCNLGCIENGYKSGAVDLDNFEDCREFSRGPSTKAFPEPQFMCECSDITDLIIVTGNSEK